MVSDELTHSFSVNWQVSGGWLATDGLVPMSGTFLGVSGPPFLHVLFPPEGRWNRFSHQSAAFQRGDNESRLELGRPTALLLSYYIGHNESTDQPRLESWKNKLHLLMGGSNNFWSCLMYHYVCLCILSMIIYSLVVKDSLQNLFLLENIHDVFTFYSLSFCLLK